MTKNKLEQLKQQLLQLQSDDSSSIDYKQKLIKKLDKIAEKQIQLYYEDSVAQLEQGLQEEIDPVKIKIWKKALNVVRESDKEEYNKQVEDCNQKVR